MLEETRTRSTELRQVMDQSFVLVLSTWTMRKLVAFLSHARYSHIVVLRQEGESRYHYLFSKAALRDAVTRFPADATVHQAFNLHEYSKTAEASASADAGEATAPATVVLDDEGHVVGFIDTQVEPTPPSAAVTARGAQPSQTAGPFTGYSSLVAPDVAKAGVPFDIAVGFSDTPDPKLGNIDPIRIEKPRPGDRCLVVLSGDGITLDRDRDHVPISTNAVVHFSGTLHEGVDQGRVKALFIYDDQVIGLAQREILSAHVDRLEPVGGTLGSPCRMSLPQQASAVDVTVSITLKRDGTLEWLFVAGGSPLPGPAPSTVLPDTKEFAGELMRDLKALQFGGPFARNVLETAGQQISAIMPPEFFQILSAVHARIQRTPTLLLLTNEAYVPWELAYLATPLDPASLPFLGAQTIMGRWVDDPNIMLPPSVSLEVERMTAVASEYGLLAGQSKLTEARAEQQALCDRWGAIPLDATQAEMQAMVTGTKIPGHLVHFAVHGYSDPMANNQALLLADKSTLPASALTGAYSCGQTPRFSFVFLNACQVGTPGRSLGHAGGFPGVLVRGGTVGFIAPLWDVHDDIARKAAEAFYEAAFTQGITVGGVLQARRNVYSTDSTTPLAYIYYGHPGLRLTRAG